MKQLKSYLKSEIFFSPAVVCYLKKGNHVLLGLRKKVSLGLGENLIAGIGGKVGDSPGFEDETHEEALIREVHEEIEIQVLKYRRMGRVRFLFPHKPQWNQDVQVYVVNEWKGEPQETDVIKPIWVEVGDLPISQMWDDNTYWVPKVLLGEYVDAIFLYADDNKVIEQIFY